MYGRHIDGAPRELAPRRLACKACRRRVRRGVINIGIIAGKLGPCRLMQRGPIHGTTVRGFYRCVPRAARVATMFSAWLVIVDYESTAKCQICATHVRKIIYMHRIIPTCPIPHIRARLHAGSGTHSIAMLHATSGPNGWTRRILGPLWCQRRREMSGYMCTLKCL